VASCGLDALAQERDKCRALVNTAMKLQGP